MSIGGRWGIWGCFTARRCQMQIYTLNNGGMVSDSTLSPSSTPFPGPQCNPWCSYRRAMCFVEDVVPWTAPPRALARLAAPRDTSPELLSGEETAGESKVDDEEVEANDGEWIDEDVGNEDITDDLLQLKFHTNYFHALDREMDTTLVLLASPSHTAGSMQSRHGQLVATSGDLNLAAWRRALRSPSLLKQLQHALSSSRDGSPSSSSDVHEEDVRRTLDTAIGSLHAIGSLYEQRERRWVEEKQRLDKDKDKVQLLLKQVLGVGVGNLIDTTL
ncbi:hypothetical protein BGW80DRAFT_1247875 [Lactifluus volemus]|nr:hypothetical protein BGW80DRAFT_1247875 [Lactifluus volemus]